MPDDMQVTVYNALRTAQEKYTYFLLAAAGAAIAFAINQTHDTKLAWTQLPLGLSVLCWGVSFFFGCLHLQYGSDILYDNAEMLRMQSGVHPMVGSDSKHIAAASQIMREIMEKKSNNSNRYANIQFRLVPIGAVLYLIWHIYQMYLRAL